FSWVNAGGQIGLKGGVGAGLSALHGGNPAVGFGYGAAFGAADAGYQGYVGYSATNGPLPDPPADPNGGYQYRPNALHQPPPYTNVAADNADPAVDENGNCTNCWRIQGGPLSHLVNDMPGGAPAAAFHDRLLAPYYAPGVSAPWYVN